MTASTGLLAALSFAFLFQVLFFGFLLGLALLVCLLDYLNGFLHLCL